MKAMRERLYQTLKETGRRVNGRRLPSSPERHSWESMWTRCTNSHHDSFRYYGARGITVCERWKNFQFFVDDMGRRPSKAYSLDRIDPNGNYEPSNCRWATRRDQSANKRKSPLLTIDGVSLLPMEWADRAGHKRPNMIAKRLAAGWSVERAVFAPPGHKKNTNGKYTLDGQWISKEAIARHLAMDPRAYSKLIIGIPSKSILNTSRMGGDRISEEARAAFRKVLEHRA